MLQCLHAVNRSNRSFHTSFWRSVAGKMSNFVLFLMIFGGMIPLISMQWIDDNSTLNVTISGPLLIQIMAWRQFAYLLMMTLSNGNIFPRYWPFAKGIQRSPVNSTRKVTRGLDVFLDLHLNKRLSEQSRRWWFETPPRPLWRHCTNADCVGPVKFVSHYRGFLSRKRIWKFRLQNCGYYVLGAISI